MCFACNMDDLFSLSVHHGGYFTDNPRKYMGGKVDVVENYDPDRWSKTKIDGICKHFGYTSMSRLYYKIPGKDQERANFHLIVDDHDAMFMTNLVMGHEEIHVFVEHSVDDPILVDEGEDIREDVQPLAVEQNLLGYYDDDDSNDNGSEDADNDEDGVYGFYGSNDMYVSDEDHNNDNEYPIELDAKQAYSRREGRTPIIQEVNDDDVVEVDAVEMYSRRAGKENMTQHSSEDKAVADSSDSGGGDSGGNGLKDEDIVNPDEREFVEDNSDGQDGNDNDEDIVEPIQMGAGIMNSYYEIEELHNLEESSFDDDNRDDSDDNFEDELKTHVGKGKGQKPKQKRMKT